ncbi:hypothetical protein E2C01_039088 [Portunus trituberculatus]|uniref:Uncharacterized protein n=1 Tax=Portunus trituberculatus TaxID=210409 RepID=A0A5B7FCP5_PORTR|nr:hypothetical protein [Portunus trituberculatus]
MVIGEQDGNQPHQNYGDACLHLLGGSPPSPAHPDPDMEATLYHHSEVGGLQTTCYADLSH